MIPRAILHIPHAARRIPPGERARLLPDDRTLRDELLRMTDAFTDRLFAPPGPDWTALRFPVSRLVVDPERFPDAATEPMEARGMGAVYVRTSRGEPLRAAPDPAERERLMARWYRPHHARLTAAVRRILDAHGRCLIVDGHSFASTPLPHEPDRDPDRPDVCVGTDPDHTPPALRDAAVAGFQAQGWSVAVDRPFGGALVPAAFHRIDRRVGAVMVEMNRRLYMDERTGRRRPGFKGVRAGIAGALAAILDAWTAG